MLKYSGMNGTSAKLTVTVELSSQLGAGSYVSSSSPVENGLDLQYMRKIHKRMGRGGGGGEGLYPPKFRQLEKKILGAPIF